MATKQATIQCSVSFSDFTKLQQNIICEYYPIVEKLFFVTPTNNIEPSNTADYQLRDDVFEFLHSVDIIFGKNLAKSSISEDLSTDQFILQHSLASCRLNYRKQFRGYAYLTVRGIENAHTLATQEAILKMDLNATRFNLTGNEKATLREKLLSDLQILRLWTNEVNNMKKSSILREIQSECLENLKTLIEEEFPFLFGETQREFYDRFIFRQKSTQIKTTAVASFQEQIPFKEDELSEAQICEEFQHEVVKVLENLASKNKSNKENAKRLITAEVDTSVAKYTNAIGLMFGKEPMAEPYNLRIQHETLQDLHLPIPNTMVDDLRSKYLEQYFMETDHVFQELVREHSKSSSKSLRECYQDMCEVSDRFVSQEVTQIFQKHKVPIQFIEQTRKSLNDLLEKVIDEIRDSTIANPEIAENIAQGTSKKICGTFAEDDSNIAFLLHVNIRLLTGVTHKINAYSVWTVDKLRQKFMKCLGRDYTSCSLYHKTKKLRDENTLQSYNIKDGDILMSNI